MKKLPTLQEQVQPKSKLKDDEEEFWQPTCRLALEEQDGFVTKRKNKVVESSQVQSKFLLTPAQVARDNNVMSGLPS